MSAQTAAADLDRTLLALADPTRRGVVELLRQQPRRAGELAQALSMTPPAISRHLRLLRKTGLVTESELEHDARVRVYRLQAAPFVELRSWLEQMEAVWSEQLGAFKAHVERDGGRAERGKSVGVAGKAERGKAAEDSAAEDSAARNKVRPKAGRARVRPRATVRRK